MAIINAISAVCGLVAGALIGVSFGMIQDAALRRHQKLQNTDALKTGLGTAPGSFRRVAYLLVALALVQLVCPLLFKNGCQWWVSGGVAAGYGSVLYIRLRQRLSQHN